MQLQRRQRESLPPQQLHEWCASRSGGGGSSGNRCAGVQLGVSCGGLVQLQRRPRATLTPQQLREWYAQRGAFRSSARCPYVIRTGDRAGQNCGTVGHTQSPCFSSLRDTWHAEFGDAAELPRWLELLQQGIEAATLGASGSALLGTAPAGASRYLFRDRTTLTPLSTPVPVRLADPSRGPVLARSSNVLPCPAVPSGSLCELHLPSFSTNLVSTAALQDAMVTTTTPRGSTLYTLATKPPQVAASAQVSASGLVAPPCSCRLLSHQTLLWHHRIGHPSLQRLHGMHSRLLVSGLPRPMPPLPPSPAPPCLPCVEGRQRAAPHSSSFPPTTAPLQTIHMDVWGPARVSGQGRERYFLLVVDDYTRYTTVFPLRSKGEVPDVLIPWIRAFRLQLCDQFRQDLPVLRLHSDRGGEFSSDLLRDFCCEEGVLQPFTLPASPQQNEIAEHRICLVMEVAWEVGDASVFRVWGSCAFVGDTSVDKLSTRAIPCVFLGFPLDAPGWQFYHPTLSRVILSQDVTVLLPQVSQVDPLLGTALVEVALDSGAARGGASGGAASRGAEPGGTECEGAGFRGAEPGAAERGGAEPAGVEPGDAEPESAESGGAAPRGTTSSRGRAGTSPRLSPRPEPLSLQQLREWFAQRTRLRSGAAGAGDSAARDTRAGGAGVTARAGGTGGAAAAGPGGARTRGSGAAGTGGVGGAGAGGAGASDPRAGGAGGGGAVSRGTGVGGNVRPRPYFVPLLQAERRELASLLASHVRTGHGVPHPHPPPVPGTHAMALRHFSVPLRVPLPPPPQSSLPAFPDAESDRAHADSPTVSRLLATVLTDPSFESTTAYALVVELVNFNAACCLDYATALVAESASTSPPSVRGECALGTDVLEDRQEEFECLAAAVPRFASMLLAPEGDPDAPDIPTPRSYAEAITGPNSSQWQAAMDAEMTSWKSTGTYVDAVPLSQENIVDGMWIFKVKRPPGSPPAFKARYVARGFSQRQRVDYFKNFSPTQKMTTLRVLLRVATQRDYQTTLAALGFTPSTTDPSLFLRTDTSLPPLYVLLCGDDLVFANADTEALTHVKSELQKRHTGTDMGPSALRLSVLLATTHSSVYRPLSLSSTFGQVLRAKWSIPSACGLPHVPDDGTRPDLSYPLSLLDRYVALGRHRKVHWDAAKRVLHYLCSSSSMGLVLGGRGPVVLAGHVDASWVDDLATQRSSQGYTFSLGSGSVSWQSTCSSSVLGSICEAEIYARAMAAQELCWLTYLLTDLGEQPRSPPVLYVDNKAMIAFCPEHILEHGTKYIALLYFLARELQQRGQLCLACVATRANIADIFTKALPPGDHQPCFAS
ncbi:unnamed protein product [Closterium sp. NIES-53]